MSHIQMQKQGVFNGQILSIFDIDDSANILREPFLKYSPAKKWSIRQKQLRLPANGRLEGLLLPLKGLLNLDEEDKIYVMETG